MKKSLNKIIALLLSIAVMLSTLPSVFAKDNDVTPVIIVPGLGATALYMNPGTEEQSNSIGFNFDFNTFISMNDTGLLSDVFDILYKDDVDFEELMSALKEFAGSFENLACDENGDSLYNVGINSYWEDSLANHTDYLNGSSNEPAIARQISDIIGAENVYLFSYDWRLDVCETAEQLNNMIDNVKASTGSEKVTLVSCSLGTCVVSAYIDAHSDKKDIEKSVFVNGAFAGVSVTAAYKQDLRFNAADVIAYAETLENLYYLGDIDVASIRKALVSFRTLIENACEYLTQVVDNKEKLNRIYNEVLKPVIGNIPALWECMPYEYFDEAVQTMSDIGFLDTDSGLYSKINKYHQVQGRFKANVQQIKDNGAQIAIVSNYGIPGIPITSEYQSMTDVLIDTKYSSGFATVADCGSTLSVSGKYVSKDKLIDASTAYFPDNTWFMKNIMHVAYQYDSEATQFLAYLVATDTPLDIDSVKEDTEYDQFLLSDEKQNLTNVEETADTTADEKKTTVKSKKSSDISPETGNDSVLAGVFTAAGLAVLLTVVLKKRKE